MLGLVAFCGMAPVSIIGPFAGILSDTMDRKRVMMVSQALFGVGALFLAYATYNKFVQPFHIVAVATLFGVVGAFEMPARQSTLSRVVPPEDLPAAVPLNAMTFNTARIFGPAIGGLLLSKFGAAACYALNGFSYLFLISAVWALKANLKPSPDRRPEPVQDLLLEGMRYTFRDRRLRTLFLMEATTSCFGLVYLALLPGFAKDYLNLDARGLSTLMTSIGIGALLGLLLTARLSSLPYKRQIVLAAMTTMAVGMLCLSMTRNLWLVYPLLAIIGGSAIMQFNTTNVLFQTLSPERLRGRVIAMHVWALSGVGPFGTLGLSWVAQATKGGAPAPLSGIPLVLLIGGLCVGIGALAGFIYRRNLEDLP
jgi:MFS family permease